MGYSDGDNHSLTCTLHEFNATQGQALASLIGYSLVGSVGVVGNSVVICVFYGTRDKTLKFLIFALSIVDLTSCGLVLPLDLFRMYRKHFVSTEFHLDHIFADIVVCVRNTCFAVEGSVLFCVALDRFCCICRPTQKRIVSGLFIAVVICLVGSAIMGIEGSLTIVHLFVDTECLLVIPMRKILMFSFITLSFCGMAVFSYLYLRIFLVIRQRNSTRNRARRPWSNEMSSMCSTATGSSFSPSPKWKNGTGGSGSKAGGHFFSRNNTRTRRTALMLFCSTLLFYATIMPIILAHLNLIPEGPYHKLYYINNATNVIMYSLLNPNFRRETRKFFKTRCQCCVITKRRESIKDNEEG